MLKNYVGISRDHSISMRGLHGAAVADYNLNIRTLKENADKYDQDTIVSVVENGRDPTRVVSIVTNSSVSKVKEINPAEYKIDGIGTPLWDSVGMLIEQFKKVPDYDNENVSFVVMVITDGQENSSKNWSTHTLVQEIKRLTATDRWTFVFRVPRGARGGAYYLHGLGIPNGNIQEWDTTEEGLNTSSDHTKTSMDMYYYSRSTGKKSVDKFFADTVDLTKKDVKRNLVDISSKVQIFTPKKSEVDVQIRDFIESRGKNFVKGAGFYQLMRSEKVQEYKKFCLYDKLTGAVYTGIDARHLLGLPDTGQIKLAPGSANQYEVFVQSTSVNRLVRGKILWYPDAV